jgi:nitrite reductase/ring-hydroxylating ferredoxin subunit
MAWEKTIPEQDLTEGKRQVVKLDGKSVLLLNHCGKIFAISSTCPHWGLPLETGRLTDDCGIICPWHRSGFDLPTGDVKAWAPWPPGLGLVLGATSRKKVLPTYPVRIEDGNIMVDFGQSDPGKPEPVKPEEAKTSGTSPEQPKPAQIKSEQTSPEQPGTGSQTPSA